MSKVKVIDARKDLADILNRAAYGKGRVVLTRRGKDVAAIVPMDDLAILEAIEDHMDVTESEKILERVRRGSEETLSLKARLRKSCGRPGQLSPRVNIMHYVTSPHSAKPRRWPPDTCGMAFEKLILRILFPQRALNA